MSYVRYQKSLLANGDFEMGGSFESLLGNGTGTTAHESRWREVSIVVGKWRIEMGEVSSHLWKMGPVLSDRGKFWFD